MARILVVEDEEHIRFLIRKVLQSVGHSSTEAKNGLEALEILNASSFAFDLILLDIRMPVMDGFEFLEKIKSFPSVPPVVVLSAHWDQIPTALQQGAKERLIKPFTREKLIEVINRLVKNPPALK